MRETVEATGFVLRADPQGEYDKRLTILTREVGKITVFARGARRTGSPYLAASNPFVFATFVLYEGHSAYTLSAVREAVYFTEIAALYPGVYYGFYFLDLASFYGQENLEAGQMVNLLYTTLRALLRNTLPLALIRDIFELRLMWMNGDIALPEEGSVPLASQKAFYHVTTAPMKLLYTFTLDEEAYSAFHKFIDDRIRAITGGKLRSLFVLAAIDEAAFNRYNRKDEKNEDI